MLVTSVLAQSSYNLDYQLLLHDRINYGVNSKEYNTTLVGFALEYSEEPEYYEQIVNLLSDNIKTIQNLFGIDSPIYRNSLICLNRCLLGKYRDLENYNRYKDKAIQHLIDLEDQINQVDKNKIEFATLLSSVYQFYQIDMKKAIKYGRLKYDLTRKNFPKTSSEYRYAIVNLICVYGKDNKRKSVLELLKELTNMEYGESAQIELANIINFLPTDLTLEIYTDILSEYQKSQGSIDIISLFTSNMASANNIDVLNFIEKQFIRNCEDKTIVHNYYSGVAGILGNAGGNASMAIDYFKKALAFAAEMKKPLLNYTEVEGKKNHIWDRIAVNYERLEDEVSAVNSYIESAKCFEKDLSDIENYNNRLEMAVGVFARYYEHSILTNNELYPQLKTFVDNIEKAEGTLNTLFLLSRAIERRYDVVAHEYLEKKFIGNTDTETGLDFLIGMADLLEHDEFYYESIREHIKAIEFAQSRGKNLLAYHEYQGLNYNRWLSVSFCQSQLGQDKEAIESLKKALDEIGKDIGKNSKEYYECAKSLATSYSLSYADYDLKIQYELIALLCAENVFGINSNEYVNTIESLGYSYQKKHDHANAMQYVEKGLQISTISNQQKSRLYNLKAMISADRGDWDACREDYKEAINLAENWEDKLTYTCNFARMLKEQEIATQGYSKDILVLLSQRSPITTIDTLKFHFAYNTLSYIETDRKKAWSYLLQSEKFLISSAYEEMFLHYQNKATLADNSYQRIEALEKALKVYKEHISNPIHLGSLMAGYGDYYHSILDYDKSSAHYRTAMEIYDKNLSENHPSKLALYNNFALNESSKGNKAYAVYLYELILHQNEMRYGREHSYYITTLHNIISEAADGEEFDKADKYMKQLLAATSDVKSPMHILSLILKAKLEYKKGNYTAAENQCNNLLKEKLDQKEEKYLYETLQDIYAATSSPKLMPTVHRNIQEIKREISEMYLYMTETERQSTMFYLNNIQSDLIKKLGIASEITSDAFEFSLYSKGLLFHTQSEISRILSSNKKTQSEWDEILQIRNEYNLSTSQGDSLTASRLKAEYENKIRLLSNENVSLKQLQNKLGITINHVKKKLGIDDLAIDFILYKDKEVKKYGAFVYSVKRGNPVFVELCKEEDINQLLKKQYGEITRESYISLFKNKDIGLYGLIWQKLIPYMEGCKNIYFCGDGILNQLAIEYVTDNNDKQICDAYQLHRVFHLAEIKQNNSVGTSFVGIGVADHNSPVSSVDRASRGNWDDLDGVESEITMLKDKLSKHEEYSKTFFFNDDANEKNVKDLSNQGFNILHIATHGFYMDNSTLVESAKNEVSFNHYVARRALQSNKTDLSGLILREGNITWKSAVVNGENDDILTSEEIELMNFPKLNLTVLSCCQTGLGNVDKDGVWGLQRAFRIAGTESLICTTCSIDDASTAKFMDCFYTTFLNGESIYSSFHKAQNLLFNTFKNKPKIWTSFILIE